ncbi:MAG: S41 family peptidase [Christiangramia sp.]|uniref:S41 family peptidase n=1 Tax=Christiangramia sp. TaxID=1931228 RepID=UPI003242AFF7
MKLFLLSVFVFIIGVQAQNDPKFNLDFEKVSDPEALPDNWIRWGNYEISVDDRVKYSGKYSAEISSEKGGSFGSIAYGIPANYEGNYLQLEGYMKTENVEGSAGLLIRVDDASGKTLSFKDMSVYKIGGTTIWKKYKVLVPFSSEAHMIYVGGILQGKGMAWFDNFTLKVGRKDIQNLKETLPEYLPADLDSSYTDHSNFQLENLSAIQEKNLYKLAKVWGFLKYYHPEIAKGHFNWDYELFRILPETNSKDFDAVLAACIEELGPVEGGKSEKPDPKDFEQSVDLGWLEDEQFLSAPLSAALLNVLTADREKENYYIGLQAGVKNPDFKNEKAYENMTYDDTGMKLLALFKYWNMIEYYFPYKYLIDEDWDEVLKEYIPKMIKSQTEKEYKLDMLQLIGEINDSHGIILGGAEVLDHFFGKRIAPIRIRFIEEQPVVDFTDDSIENIQKGAVITAINGRPVAEIIAKNLDYYPASNYPTKLRNMAEKLLRTNDDSLQISFQDDQETFARTVKTLKSWNWWTLDEEIPSHKMLSENIGYIYPQSLKKDEIHDIMKAYMDTDGIVLDLRCYPADFIVFKMGDHVIPKPTEFVKFTKTSMENPGFYDFQDGPKNGNRLKQTYDGKIVILINEMTQSQAEYTAMALRIAPRAMVVGSTTAGADGNVSRIILPGGINTMISGIGVYYPDGTETQRVGIVPDIELEPTIKGFRNGQDELLNKAIQLIESDNSLAK